MKPKFILWLFLAVSVTNLVAQIIDSTELIRFTKPVLMPLLFFYIYESSKGRVTLRILLLSLAILFSWVGDVTLMYQGELYFLVGIGFFLLAQITYIYVLFKSSYQAPLFNVIKILPFFIYSLGLFKLLVPSAGTFKAPIIVYGIIISAMAGMARLREGNTSQISYRLALYGSILFVISDSILAIDKFYQPIPLSGLWIMSSYIGAQYLLIKGILNHVD